MGAAWCRAGAQRGIEQGRSVTPCRGAACGRKEVKLGARLGRCGGARGKGCGAQGAWDCAGRNGGCAWAERGAAQGAQRGAT